MPVIPTTVADDCSVHIFVSVWFRTYFSLLQPPEGPSSLPPCLPAETAQINQGDLTDALIDTGRNGRDHSESGMLPAVTSCSSHTVNKDLFISYVT